MTRTRDEGVDAGVGQLGEAVLDALLARLDYSGAAAVDTTRETA